MENGNPQLHLTTSQIAQRNRIDRHAVFHEDVDRAERIRHTWCAADARVKIGEIGLERLKAAPCVTLVHEPSHHVVVTGRTRGGSNHAGVMQPAADGGTQAAHAARHKGNAFLGQVTFPTRVHSRAAARQHHLRLTASLAWMHADVISART
jgi:hypothetical protein